MCLDDGVDVSWEYLRTTVRYEGRVYTLDIPSFDRIWKKKRDIGDPDDIGEIGP